MKDIQPYLLFMQKNCDGQTLLELVSTFETSTLTNVSQFCSSFKKENM